MSQNDSLSEAVVPVEQMQIDGINSLPLAAQPLVQVNRMLETSILQLPSSFAEQHNYSSAFAPLQTMQGGVEAVALQNMEQTSMSIKGSGIFGIFEVCNLFGRDSDNNKEGVQHRNYAAKECKLAEFKYKAEVLPQLSKDKVELQKHRAELTAELTRELEKDRTASALKWHEINNKMVSSAMNHQQNVINSLSNHVLGLKKLDLEKDNINLQRDKVKLEMLKVKNNREPFLKRLQPKKNHRGGRGRGRHQSHSQPIVEEVESERQACFEPF